MARKKPTAQDKDATCPSCGQPCRQSDLPKPRLWQVTSNVCPRMTFVTLTKNEAIAQYRAVYSLRGQNERVQVTATEVLSEAEKAKEAEESVDLDTLQTTATDEQAATECEPTQEYVEDGAS